MTTGGSHTGTARLPLLDGMRGFAALYVMSYHAWIFGLVGPLMQRGYPFVDLFFVMSGFVLARAFDARLRSDLRPVAFMAMRVRRLWPMVAAGSLLGLVAISSVGRFWDGMAWLPYSLFLIPAVWLPKALFPLNGPQWSLVFELLANALHALVLARLRTEWLAVVVLATGAILAMCIADAGANELGMNGAQFLPGIPRVMFGYGAGLLIARFDPAEFSRRLPRLTWPLVLVLPVAAIAALPMAPVSVAVGDIAIVLIGFPLWLMLAIDTPVSAEMAPWLGRIGLISYPLYAVHLPILQLALIHLPLEVARIAGALGAVGLAALLAWTFEARRAHARRRIPIAARQATA